MRKLYRDEWFGAVSLIGVDPRARRAVLRLESGAPPRLAVDTVDLATGSRVERWEATPERVAALRGAPTFRPLTSTFEEDLVRFAGKLASLGPWAHRGTPLVPTVVVAPEARHILFGAPPTDGTDGDWLWVVDAAGRNPKRIDVGMRASYSPSFSPDGARVAWRGCGGSPCDYGIYVAPTPSSVSAERPPRPRRLGSIIASKPPVWSLDGLALFVVGPKGKQSCLFRVQLDARAKVDALQCLEVRDPSFAQDPEGRTGAFCGTRGTAGSHTMDCLWVHLEDGAVVERHAIDRGVGAGVLSPSGLFAVPLAKGGVAVVDLVTGRHGRAAESEGWFSGFETTQWIEDELILLRKLERDQGFELVSVDGRKTAG